MKCQRCDFNVTDNAHYCENCGHNLMFDRDEENAQTEFKAFDDTKLKEQQKQITDNNIPNSMKLIAIIFLGITLSLIVLVLLFQVFLSSDANTTSSLVSSTENSYYNEFDYLDTPPPIDNKE